MITESGLYNARGWCFTTPLTTPGGIQEARVTTDEQGEPLFVLKDICDALNLGNTSKVADHLDANDLTQSKVIDNRGRSRTTNIVTEAGLYEGIFMSRKPEGPHKQVNRQKTPCHL